jgi:hypothetical protein
MVIPRNPSFTEQIEQKISFITYKIAEKACIVQIRAFFIAHCREYCVTNQMYIRCQKQKNMLNAHYFILYGTVIANLKATSSLRSERIFEYSLHGYSAKPTTLTAVGKGCSGRFIQKNQYAQ